MEIDVALPRPWVTAVLDTCVLGVLDGCDRHGYAIARALEEAGLGTVKGGTLYPLLARMEADGLLAHRWEPGEAGPPRKCYTLTDGGRQRLAAARAQWETFAASAGRLLRATPTEGRNGEG